jgi:cell division protease FtsH
MSWKERLLEWDKVLEREELKDEQLAKESVFVIPVSIDEARKNLLNRKKEQVESMPSRAYLVTRKWWQYRPKLPYMFFLSKVEKGEVQ